MRTVAGCVDTWIYSLRLAIFVNLLVFVSLLLVNLLERKAPHELLLFTRLTVFLMELDC